MVFLLTRMGLPVARQVGLRNPVSNFMLHRTRWETLSKLP